jgi:uracil phosphoribosyltransferase
MLPDTYIICSEAARSVLYSPNMAGKRLQDAMQKNSEIFARIASRHALAASKRASICELVLLSGGLFYFLNYGFKKEFSFALPQCFIGIQRQRVEGKPGTFRAVAGYENFESLPDNANVIIGDTVATGSTLVKGIQLLLDAAEDKGTSIASITIFTLAGSPEGARQLAKLNQSHIQKQHPGCKVSFFACEMLFHLMPDGTDLRFLMPDSIMPEESRQEAAHRYGKYLSKNMRCAVFDWGTRCKNPREHYLEFLKYADKEMEGLKLDEKGRAVLLKMKKEAEKSLEEMEGELEGKK